jgi:type IV secretory pathway VirB4 component
MANTPTQQFLEIKEIKEGVVILKNNSIRGVLMVSSVNFALKSEDEQNAIIYQFQSFLNSLDFSIQITIQSRKLNITGYIDKLKDMEKKQENELLKIQTAAYREFVEELISGGSIMSKSFFVTVPFSFIDIPDFARNNQSNDEEEFQRLKAQLWQRIEFIASGLRRCGLKCVPLNTSELIELYWSLHHPEEAEVGYYPEIPPELIK